MKSTRNASTPPGKSSSSNSLASMTESATSSSTADSSTSFSSAHDTSSSSSASSLSSRPIHITRASFDRRPAPSSGPTMLAQSAPTLSWIPPPAPSSRPRVASIEPPPMELPPSPPVWSPLAAEATAAAQQANSSSTSSIAIAQHSNAHLQPVQQKYSRSLSHYSSSAPTHAIDYLSAFRNSRGAFGAVAAPSSSEQKMEDDDDDDDRRRAAAGGTIDIQPAQHSSTSASSVDPSILQLSKSPTILGMLQHNDGLTPPTSGTAGGSNFYRRPSLVDSHIAEGEEEEEEQRGDREKRSGAPAAAPSSAMDDLQFSISLNDEAAEEEDGGGFDTDALY